MKKKGLARVVSVVLIVVLALVAVSGVWYYINTILEENSKMDTTKLGVLSIPFRGEVN